MKNRSITNLLLLSICSMLCMMMQSCQETDDLRSEIDSLKDRIKVLEEAAEKLNTSIESLQYLLTDAIIVGVTVVDNGYELELSDGRKINVFNSEKVDAMLPLLSVDNEGYWTYSIDKGATFLPLKDAEGNRILAIPHNGEGSSIKSPKLRVDNEGYWQISYDGGTTFKPMTDADGNPVKATGEGGGNSLFQSVTYNPDTKELKIILAADGRELIFPVIDTFYLKVLGTETEQIFPLGEKRIYEVEQNEVAEAVIQAPANWQVSLGEKLLTITAPSGNNIERKDVIRIVITSAKGYIRIIPIHVKLLTTGFDANATTAWNEFNNNLAGNILLDFSFAGYKHGEEAPADVMSLGYTVYNVKEYGAIPNDGNTDREAITKIIEKIGSGVTNARAIIYFPEGEYILHTSADDVDGVSKTINMVMGGVVIKGAGRDKTFLKMAAPGQPTNPSQMWTSPVMMSIRHNGGAGLTKLAGVTGDANKGDFTIEVDAPSAIKAGNWVCLKLINNDSKLVEAELGRKPDPKMTDIINNGVQVYDYHLVKSVSGNRITFKEPLMHTVEAKWGWEVCQYPHYENVGIEDLTFVGDAKSHFEHHGSWEDDGGYKPIDFVRLTNSWMRRVGFQSVSEAFTISMSANVSAYDVTIGGTRGHSAIRSQASSRVFIGKVADHSNGYLEEVKNSPYTEGLGQYHACGVSKQSMGTVIWNVNWGSDACFESHATQPRATLIDQCSGGFMHYREGGDEAQLPNHLDDLTLWNFNATSTSAKTKIPFVWWDTSDRWIKNLPPTIVGFHGITINFGPEDQGQYKRNEGQGSPVNPYSLYEAQLRKRLGFVPAWLNSLK